MHVRRGLRVTSQERNPTRRARCERSLVQTGFDWTVAAETRSPAMEIDQRIRALCGDLQERLANGSRTTRTHCSKATHGDVRLAAPPELHQATQQAVTAPNEWRPLVRDA
jgi:hypothetical protein